MLRTLLVLFIGLTLRQPAGATDSASACLPSPDSCDFYSCLNESLGCSRQEYILSYGDKYCRKFLRLNDQFSTQAQGVLRNIRYCLQENLAISESLTCQSVGVLAQDHHVDCYVQHGFCDLSFADKTRIFRYIQDDFWSPENRKTAIRVRRACRSK